MYALESSPSVLYSIWCGRRSLKVEELERNRQRNRERNRKRKRKRKTKRKRYGVEADEGEKEGL